MSEGGHLGKRKMLRTYVEAEARNGADLDVAETLG